MNGKYIMSFASSNSDAKSRASLHFKKLRSNGYDNVKKDMKDIITEIVIKNWDSRTIT